MTLDPAPPDHPHGATDVGTSPDPVVDVLAEIWASFGAACDGLADQDWDRATDCPGWTVRDQLSHIIGFELVLGGEAPPPAPPNRPAHVRNDIGAGNEAMVALRRSRPGSEVLAEFVALTASRLDALRRLPPADFDVVGWSPVGEAPLRGLLATRAFDSWVHEQDVRRALDRPGGRGGGGEEETLSRVATAMGYVVGKKVAPPEGTVVEWAVDGPLPREVTVVVRDGRGRVLGAGDARPAAPTVRLSLEAGAFWRLGCGRSTPEEVRRAGAVTIEGDAELGQRVLDAMNFMF